MRIFVAVILTATLCSAALNDSNKSEQEEIGRVCMQEENISPGELKFVFSGNLKRNDTNIKENMKCFIRCFLEKQGFMKSGIIQDDVMTKKLSDNPDLSQKDQLGKNLSECKNLKGANECDTAFMVLACLHERKVIFG